MQTLVLFSVLLGQSVKWSLFVELELAPLMWMLGVGYEAPDAGAMVPYHKFLIQVPTLRLEFRLARRSDIEKAVKLQAELEAAAT